MIDDSRCRVVPAATCRSSLCSGILLACASRGRWSFPKVILVLLWDCSCWNSLCWWLSSCGRRLRGCVPRGCVYTSNGLHLFEDDGRWRHWLRCNGKASAAGCNGFMWHCMVVDATGVYTFHMTRNPDQRIKMLNRLRRDAIAMKGANGSRKFLLRLYNRHHEVIDPLFRLYFDNTGGWIDYNTGLTGYKIHFISTICRHDTYAWCV